MRWCALVAGLVVWSFAALAHDQVMVVSEETVGGQKGVVRDVDIRFLEHAMQANSLLPMAKPKAFGVLINGKKHDLLGTLQSKSEGGKTVYTCSYSVKEAGAHLLYLEPAAYWDSGEGAVITHYTKVLFNSCGANLKTKSAMGWENWEGWEARVGFPVEIDPLVQCTSLWTGSVFRGVVRDGKGKSLRSCRIEVEYYNKDGAVTTPDPSFLTQILKTDSQGTFSFTPIRSGWWALTALPESGKDVKGPDGKMAEVEIGGVLWIHANDMKEHR